MGRQEIFLVKIFSEKTAPVFAVLPGTGTHDGHLAAPDPASFMTPGQSVDFGSKQKHL
ncbi:MAG: hypothetical protein JJ902_06485 [Roseibium sp.]|nr:hypothetical protein [Roseibium sp.]